MTIKKMAAKVDQWGLALVWGVYLFISVGIKNIFFTVVSFTTVGMLVIATIINMFRLHLGVGEGFEPDMFIGMSVLFFVWPWVRAPRANGSDPDVELLFHVGEWVDTSSISRRYAKGELPWSYALPPKIFERLNVVFHVLYGIIGAVYLGFDLSVWVACAGGALLLLSSLGICLTARRDRRLRHPILLSKNLAMREVFG